MNPDGGWRTRHLRLRSSCLRELLKSEPQNWKVRHQKGTDLPADMLTKPILLQREWIKFWHLLGFHVDHSIPKYDPEGSQNPRNGHPPMPRLQDLMKMRKLRRPSRRPKVLVSIAALSVAATSAAVGWQMRAACAAAMGALAIWPAANWDTNPSIEGRPNGVCKDGWEVEKNTRATGLKNVKMPGEMNRLNQLREDLQGKMNLEV